MFVHNIGDYTCSMPRGVSQGGRGKVRGGNPREQAKCKGQFKLGFRILTTSVGVREVRVCYTRFYGPHNLWGKGKGERDRGEGSETGSEGSKAYVILGFRVPTIYDKTKFDDNR